MKAVCRFIDTVDGMSLFSTTGCCVPTIVVVQSVDSCGAANLPIVALNLHGCDVFMAETSMNIYDAEGEQLPSGPRLAVLASPEMDLFREPNCEQVTRWCAE